MSYDVEAKIAANEAFNRRLAELFQNLIAQYAAIDFSAKKFPKVARHEYPIWFFWWQGADCMPPVPRLCLNSLLKHTKSRQVHFIDRANYGDYIDLPAAVLRKVSEGKLSVAQFSDIIRVSLLEKYGGLWIDATILVDDDLTHHPEMFGLFYTRKCSHTKTKNPAYAWCISHYRWSGFLMGSNIKHNPLFSFVKDAFLAYWQNYSQVASYLMIDYLINLAYENISFVRAEIDAVPISNPGMTLLGDQIHNHLNDIYNEADWRKLQGMTFLHKLSWKNDIHYAAKNTYYHFLRSRYGLYRPPDKHSDRDTVSIVIVCRDNKDELMATLAAVQAQDWPHKEIIVVDDGSEDKETVNLLNSLTVKTLSGMSYGFASACALGQESALGFCILILKAGDKIAEGHLRRLVAVAQENLTAARS